MKDEEGWKIGRRHRSKEEMGWRIGVSGGEKREQNE